MRRSRAKSKPQRVYFEPGVVTLLVEYADRDLQPDALVQQIKDLLRDGGPAALRDLPPIDRVIRPIDLLDGEKIRPSRAHTFTQLNPDGADLPKLPPHRQPTAGAFALIAVPLRGTQSSRTLIQLVELINQAIAGREWQISLGQGLTLRAVAPNWLITPAPGVAGGGGPGSLPTPVAPGDLAAISGSRHIDGADLAGTPFGIKVAAIVNEGAQQKGAEGQPVEVVILDTLPPAWQIAVAKNCWEAKHPLLRSLLTPGRLTRVYHDDPAWRIVLPRPNDLHLEHHDYVMSDHGLFVAGIIHSIAPQAQLRVIEVLNAYGVGYVESIAKVLGQLAREYAGKPATTLVINCSLTIMAPLAGHWSPDPATKDDLKDATQIKDAQELAGRDPASLSPDEQMVLAKLDLLALAFEWIYRAAHASNMLVVAAAGNDARPAGGSHTAGARPQARYPAAFDTVIGVGALNKQGTSASYSNRADRQAQQGLATFGGEVLPAPWRSQGRRARPAMPGQAVLGVYTGTFPRRRPHRGQNNANGWAWWAGTSFAAPIISGTIAQMVGAGLAANAVVAHRQLIAVNDGTTTEGDEVVKAAQG